MDNLIPFFFLTMGTHFGKKFFSSLSFLGLVTHSKNFIQIRSNPVGGVNEQTKKEILKNALKYHNFPLMLGVTKKYFVKERKKMKKKKIGVGESWSPIRVLSVRNFA